MADERQGKPESSNLAITLKGAVLTGGAGAGAIVMYALIEAVRSEPKMFFTMLTNWGPLFGIVVVIAVLGDRRMGELIQVNKSNSEAQQRMADAMQAIAGKRDEEAIEQRALMSYIGAQMEKVLERLSHTSPGGETSQ